MHILRFSAVETFGVPIDNPLVLKSPVDMAALMVAHSVLPQEVAPELTDITPEYLEGSTITYLSRRGTGGPAVIDVMPRHSGATSATLILEAGQPHVEILRPRSIVIPNDLPLYAMMGKVPEIREQHSIHELIMLADLI